MNNYLTKWDLLHIGGFEHNNQLKPYYGKDYFQKLANDLLKNDKIKDFQIIFSDTNNVRWYFKDGIFKLNKFNYNKYGFFLEKHKICDSPHIDHKTHYRNLVNFNLNTIDVENVLDENDKFIRDPFSIFTSANSRTICHFIKWKYNLNPHLLKDDIKKLFRIGNFCPICNINLTNGVCGECNRNSKKLNPIYIWERELRNCIIELKCPICNENFDKSTSLPRHIYRKHGYIFSELLDKNIQKQKCQDCDNDLELIKNLDKIFNYNIYLNDTFQDFDFAKDFRLFRFACKKCFNSNTYVKALKLIKYYNDNDLIQNEIDDIQRSYHNLEDKKVKIDYLFSRIRDYSKYTKFEYNNFKLTTRSQLEIDTIKDIIDKFNPDRVWCDFEINDIINEIKYKDINNEYKKYIPDFLIEKDNNKVLIEVKSGFTFGITDVFINKEMLLTNIRKFKAADRKCKSLNMNFLIYIQNTFYTLEEVMEYARQEIRNKTANAKAWWGN